MRPKQNRNLSFIPKIIQNAISNQILYSILRIIQKLLMKQDQNSMWHQMKKNKEQRITYQRKKSKNLIVTSSLINASLFSQFSKKISKIFHQERANTNYNTRKSINDIMRITQLCEKI